MKQYFGIIKLGKIENRGKGEDEIELVKARFVHYPDSQQLTIWLPLYGRHGYGTIRLVDQKTGKFIEEGAVADRLSGSIQILWDTLGIPPGEYSIEIEHPKGGQHILWFEKFKQGVIPSEKVSAPIPDNTSRPIEYRDGFGNLLPNEDLILREKLTKDMAGKFSRHLRYEGNFRSGYITYTEGNIVLRFYHEMGGGACHFYIDIPAESAWEAATKTPLHRRADILEFVAGTVQQEKAPSWRYEIKADGIYYY